MRPDNTGPLISAARRRRELTRAKAIQAVRELDHAGTPVTFETVARTALLTEQSREFPQVNWQMAASADTVPDHDRRG